MSLDELQAKIDASIRNASSLTRELFVKNHMEADAVWEFINSVRSVTVATVRASGKPHASLTVVACSNSGHLYFAVNQRSVLFRNLERSPSIALTVDAQEHGLMAAGRADMVGYARDLRDSLIPELDGIVTGGHFVPADWDGAVFQIVLDRIFAQ